MLRCEICQKSTHKVAYSRHKKGSSGASVWPHRAPIYKKTQKPNLHAYKGLKLCTKCLRLVKGKAKAKKREEQAPAPTESGSAQA